MKKIHLSILYTIVFLFSFSLFSQNKDEPVALGLPGDNLNLYAVLDVFQKSPTLEEFEKSINSKDTNINNLDLNNDKLIDYIRVVSFKEGNSYSIVLQVAINDKESQDVAVIEVNKVDSKNVIIQIIGDEELYGKNFIIEPYEDDTTSGTTNPGYKGNEDKIYYTNDWNIVVHLYSPSFVLYSSPWYWGYYPVYWSPWPPIFYHNYWGYHHHYYTNRLYHRYRVIRYPVYYSTYHNTRRTSNIVIQNRRNGNYSSTYDGRKYKTPDAIRTRDTRKNTRQTPTVRTPRTTPRVNTPRTTTPRSGTRNENTRRENTGNRR